MRGGGALRRPKPADLLIGLICVFNPRYICRSRATTEAEERNESGAIRPERLWKCLNSRERRSAIFSRKRGRGVSLAMCCEC